MKLTINFLCFLVLAIVLVLCKSSGVELGVVSMVLMTFVTYVVANVLGELK